jgi:hypothetical protein
MTTRTLVLGIPLPHSAFDNASFLSAPSFSEYTRLIVEPAAASRAIDDVVQGVAAHQTYGGQAIVNGEASTYAFSLRELLEMRRRETERLLGGSGLIVLFGHPDAPHTGVTGEPPWRRHSWLPDDGGFSLSAHLLAGFGKAGGVTLDDEGHPFAPFVRNLTRHEAYEASADDDAPAFQQGGRVFARSEGGAAVGFDLPYAGGRLVVLPALIRPEPIRSEVATVLAECLDNWGAEGAGSSQPRLLRKEAS